MPQLIEHIDQIAREKRRAVLYVTFGEPEPGKQIDLENEEDNGLLKIKPFKESETRSNFLNWLKENKISFRPCGEIANENSLMPYMGQIYLDIPYDENNPSFRKVRDFLENPDGSMKVPGIVWWCVTLEVAMKNAHHDEPGFWEKWAERF